MAGRIYVAVRKVNISMSYWLTLVLEREMCRCREIKNPPRVASA